MSVEVGQEFVAVYPDGAEVVITVLRKLDGDSEESPGLYCHFRCECGETWDEEASGGWLKHRGRPW